MTALLTQLAVILAVGLVLVIPLCWAAHATFGDFRRGGRR